MLEETKQRLRLQLEARTSSKLARGWEDRRQLPLEHLELSGELECQDTVTVRQYTLNASDNEEDLIPEEKDGSSIVQSELETPNIFFLYNS